MIDLPFVLMLSRVKRLRIDAGLSQDHIAMIFNVAEETLEEVDIRTLNDKSKDNWFEGTPKGKRSGFLMKKLKFFRVEKGLNFSIKAPQVRTLHLGGSGGIDWTLLESCKVNLKSLSVYLWGEEIQRFVEAVLEMPQLEDLHVFIRLYRYNEDLNDWIEEKVDFTNPQKVSFAFFLKTVFETKEGDSEGKKKQQMMPTLKILSISNDPMLDEETILDIIGWGSRFELPTIIRMTINLAKKCSTISHKLKEIEEMHSGFKFVKYEDW